MLFSILLAAPSTSLALTWTRIAQIPATDIESLRLQGTTLYATGNDRVYIGANLGTTWTASNALGTRSAALFAVLRAGGALWVGATGVGVFRSTNNGTNWTAVNSGLVGLGADFVLEMVTINSTIYAATGGAGVFALDLSNPTVWAPFNDGLPTSIAGNVATIVLNGTTLVAPAGGNGLVYRLPDGASGWQEVPLEPPFLPGLVATDLVSTGAQLLLSSSARIYRSDDDAQSWIRSDEGLEGGSEIFLACTSSTIFAAVDRLNNSHALFISQNAGESWKKIDEQTGAYVYELEVAGDRLFTARTDGLWWTPLATTPVQPASWADVKSRFGR